MKRHAVHWAGGLLIAAIVAMAAYDMARSYRATVANTGRELDTQARIIAEQTARSLQAVDVLLRHVASEYRRGRLARLSRAELNAYLRDAVVGLNQIDGLGMFDAAGDALGLSWPAERQPPNMASLPRFQALRNDPAIGFGVFEAAPGAGDGVWILPLARRLEATDGSFAGVIAARGRVDYFQAFYRDVQLEPGTRTALVHRKGSLVARHPPAPEALGKPLAGAIAQRLLEASGDGLPLRTRSPIDGVDRIGVAKAVPDYPLVVVVTRDADTVLAAWRSQALGTAVRTLALAALAAALLWLLSRQLTRLRQARERFALAVAGSDDGIWEHDYRAGRAFNSARARELVGMPPGPEELGLEEWLAGLPAYLHPDDHAPRKAAMDAHLEGRNPIYEVDVRHRHPDGEFRWVRIRGVCVRDAAGKPVRMAGSISDVDARRRAEEALRKSEERFALAVAGANDGILDWDIVQDRLFLSERARRILGIASGEEVLPRAEWLALLRLHPDDAHEMADGFRWIHEGKGDLREREFRVRLADGADCWVALRGKVVRDADGRATRWAGSVTDIDARKRAEEQRAQLEGELLQAKKLEAIGTLAGGIAHDFNNILSAILGYGEMAQKGAPAGSPLRRHVDAVVNAGLRAKSLVERILAFSRSGVGERVPVNVQSVVAEALDLVQASLPAHVRLVRKLDAGDAAVMGDPTQIHQVVMNLCANAAQAMKSSGTLTVSLGLRDKGDSLAATSLLAEGRYLRLRVRDTGTGIPQHVQERIFDPFFTTKEVGVGTGLGLSLVHGIVTDLGGGIVVESRVNEGTAFTVYLPWSGAKAEAARAPAPVPPGAGETILLVDDEEALVRLGEEMIAALGYEPVGFTSSRAALEAFRAEPARFQAVLSDESMPDMTGSELAREIRRVRPDLPIVLMSGFVSPALTARARELGIAEVLAKPLVSGDIARSLAAVLSS
jgi:PAS domain S-box-containing protein